jgi:hypothetical protein
MRQVLVTTTSKLNRPVPPLRTLHVLASAVAGMTLVVAGATASTVATQQANVAFGAYSARFTLASTCTTMNEVSVTDPSGTVEACTRLTADGTAASGTVLKAGAAVALGDGFNVPAGSTLTVTIDPSLDGNAYLQDDTPDGETVYAARFYLDASALGFTNDGDYFEHFVASDAAGEPVFKLVVVYDTSVTPEVRLLVQAFEDGGTIVTNSLDQAVLPTDGGYDWVEVGWVQGDGDGTAYLCVNGTGVGECKELAGLDTDTKTVHSVRWGVIDVNDRLSGQVDVDQFESQRATLIGAFTP